MYFSTSCFILIIIVYKCSPKAVVWSRGSAEEDSCLNIFVSAISPRNACLYFKQKICSTGSPWLRIIHLVTMQSSNNIEKSDLWLVINRNIPMVVSSKSRCLATSTHFPWLQSLSDGHLQTSQLASDHKISGGSWILLMTLNSFKNSTDLLKR